MTGLQFIFYPVYIFNAYEFNIIISLMFQVLSRSVKQLQWSRRGSGAIIKFPSIGFNNIIIFIRPQVKFGHIAYSLQIDPNSIIFPSGYNIQSSSYDFLQNQPQPKIIQIIYNGIKYHLSNKANQFDSHHIINAIQNPNSIYGKLKHFGQSKKPNLADINKFIIRYYLKLHALHYLRINSLPITVKIQPKLKQQILNHIRLSYEENFQKQLRKMQYQIIRIRKSIAYSQLLIDQLTNIMETRVRWYQKGALAITSFHIGSFYYMIFHVDWLGWDIVQPTTYTIAVLYSLLGVRFYRKYRIDRSEQTIKETLRNTLSRPDQRIKMKQLTTTLNIQKSQLRSYQQKIILLKDRICYTTNMVQIF